MHVNLTDANNTLIAEGNLEVNITKCPNQLRLLVPSNFAGENLNLVVAAAFPRVYQPPSPSCMHACRVLVYVDEEFHANISLLGHTGSFDWSTTSSGAYFFNVSYEGGDWTRSCLWYFCVNVSVLPLLVYFDATPTTFELGDVVSLHALAVVADTNDTFTGDLTFRFLEDGDSEKVIREVNVSSGEAYADWTYPNDTEAHTVMVNVTFLDGTGMPYMVQPLNLEVCRETKLLFWVKRGDSSRHIFHGRLLTKSGSAVSGKVVKAYLNGSLLDEDLTTNGTGHFGFDRNFNPGEEEVFHAVQVVFEGTDNKTSNLNGTDFLGNHYPVCQTRQFNYRFSTNTTKITIELQVSVTTTQGKTPEELKEVEEDGNLKWRHELTWLYPWYRLHALITVGDMFIDVGFNPLLLGGETWHLEGLEVFKDVLEEI